MVWPPAENDFEVSSSELDEEGLVASQLGDLFGGGDNEDEEEEGGGENFRLPPLLKTGSEIRGQVKFPPLPLKSALKHKMKIERAANPQASQSSQEGSGGEREEGGGGGGGGEGDGDEEAVRKLVQGAVRSSSGSGGDGSASASDGDGSPAKKLPAIRAKFEHQRFSLLRYLVEWAGQRRVTVGVWVVLRGWEVVHGKVFEGGKKGGAEKKKEKDGGERITKDGGEKDGEEAGGDASAAASAAAATSAPLDSDSASALSAPDFSPYSDGSTATSTFVLVSYNSMSLLSAARGGYLLKSEYLILASLAAFILATVGLGVALSTTEGMGWTGMAASCGVCVASATYAYGVRFFYAGKGKGAEEGEGEREEGEKEKGKGKGRRLDNVDGALFMGGTTLFGFSLLTFFLTLEGDINDVSSLWVLNLLLLYPALCWVYFKLASWQDDGWELTELDEDGDGRTSLKEGITFFGLAPVIVFALLLFVLEMYLFSDIFLATSLLLLLAALLGLVFLRDWARNEFWLSAKYQEFGDRIINWAQVASLAGVLLLPPEATMFCLSLCFLFYMCECGGQILAFGLAREAEVSE